MSYPKPNKFDSKQYYHYPEESYLSCHINDIPYSPTITESRSILSLLGETHQVEGGLFGNPDVEAGLA